MEIKVGYKYSDVGILPIDWEVKQIKEFAIFTNGKAHEQFIDDNGDFVVVNSKFISSESRVYKTSSKAYSILNEGDVCLVMSDIPNGKALAKCFIVDEKSKYTLNQRICSLKSEVTNPRYLFYILNRNKYFLAFDTGTGQTNLKKAEVIGCPVPIPPTKSEQTAIATALGDTDALIIGLEKLIEKKRAIKQGVIQQLLKPKEGWVVKKLGDCAKLKARIGWQGLTTAEYRTSGDYYLITGTEFNQGFIDWDSCHYVSEDRYKQDRNIQTQENDVLVTKDGTIGKVAFIKSMPSKPATLNSGVFVIRPIDSAFYPEFFYYILLSEIFTVFLSQLSAGSTISHLYQKVFTSFKFYAPSSIAEQRAIGQTLSDLDTEISALEQKLSKYKLLKQGMMQELLTGKTRLV